MSVKDDDHYISLVTRYNKINWMTLIGGEALLDVNRTIEIGIIARFYGVKKIEINTNASWCPVKRRPWTSFTGLLTPVLQSADPALTPFIRNLSGVN